MCDNFTAIKHDFIYRGDVLRNVPFVALDGRTIAVANPKPSPQKPFIPLWMLKAANTGAETVCLAALQRRDAIVMTRTCEGDKFSGVRRVYPAIYLAPIRPLSDFASETETGEEFAEKISKGFPPEEEGGNQTDCYRFAVMPACAEHGVESALICFREMQPVHLKYLVDATKVAKLSTRALHAVLDRFAQYMVQRESDDVSDNEPEGAISRTVQHYKAERMQEDTRKK